MRLQAKEIRIHPSACRYGECLTFLLPECEGWLYKQSRRLGAAYKYRAFINTTRLYIPRTYKCCAPINTAHINTTHI